MSPTDHEWMDLSRVVHQESTTLRGTKVDVRSKTVRGVRS